MFRSKYKKIMGLVACLLILSATVGLFIFNNHSDKNITSTNIQKTQAIDNNLGTKTSDNNKPAKEDILNPAQKYYKDYLKKYVNNFISQAKISNNNDIEFSKLQAKFIKAADVLNEKYSNDIDIADMYFQNNWIKISCVEGIYFYSVNSGYLLEKYGKYLSDAYIEWLKFIIKRENVIQDGGLIVPPDKLREYILFLEKFTEQNPEFILISDAKDILESYLMTYLEGIDNSPIFDKWNTRKMKPEFKESYEKFLAENKGSKYYPMVEELYNKSKANNFTWDKDFDFWMNEYHKKYFAN